MSYQNFDTLAQNEALINEFKGNLFEFFLASKIARYFLIETSFYEGISADFTSRLSDYQSWLAIHAPNVLSDIMRLGDSTFKAIEGTLPAKCLEVHLIGKFVNSSNRDEFGEADILLSDGQKNYPISLKLCKSNAYVNTKSAGVRSFLSQYFSSYPSAVTDQNELNKLIDLGFDRIGQTLYSHLDLTWTGRFKNDWTDAGMSELPGQLPPELRMVVQSLYKEVNSYLYEKLKSYLNEDINLFKKSLLPLLGFSIEGLLQVKCFYKVYEGEQRPDKVVLLEQKEITQDFEDLKLMPLNEDLSSFEFHLGSKKLQIRVKPMNKFTVPGFKINCSIKS